MRSRIAILAMSLSAGSSIVVMALLLGPGMGASAVERAEPQNPRHVYLRDCAQCHGANARGTQYGPDLRPSGAAVVDFMLTTGRMPVPYLNASGDQKPPRNAQQPRRPPAYDHATIEALVRYVERLTDGSGPAIPSVDVAAGDVAEGGSLYRLQCAACHAWSGDGGALLNREAPATHPATALQIGEAVRGGPGTMPAFGSAALTDAQLNSLVRYVRYLDHPDDRGGSPLWHLGPFAEGAVAILLGLGVLVVAVRWIGTRT